jgi:hypothetical protein
MTHKIMRGAAFYMGLWIAAFILAVGVCVLVVFVLASFLQWAAQYIGG